MPFFLITPNRSYLFRKLTPEQIQEAYQLGHKMARIVKKGETKPFDPQQWQNRRWKLRNKDAMRTEKGISWRGLEQPLMITVAGMHKTRKRVVLPFILALIVITSVSHAAFEHQAVTGMDRPVSGYPFVLANPVKAGAPLAQLGLLPLEDLFPQATQPSPPAFDQQAESDPQDPGENPGASSATPHQDTVLQLLDTAEADLLADRLTIPEGNNALIKYQRVLALDPANIRAMQGLERIVLRYVELAEAALGRNDLTEAQSMVERGGRILPSMNALAAIRQRLSMAGQSGEGDQPQHEEEPPTAESEREGLPGEIAESAFQVDEPREDDASPVQPASDDIWIDPLTGMEFVWVPEGCFWMGCGPWSDHCGNDEKPVHEVCLSGFWMGRHEVTQAQWMRVMGDNPSRFQGADSPVDGVSWFMAREFVQHLNALGPAPGFRLPTEAQWEYACRGGGNEERYCGGDDADSVAWHVGNSGGRSHPVGRKGPNALGLYDMSGNLAEWCEDVYDARTYPRLGPVHDPMALHGEEGDRVFRGGSWSTPTRGVRSAFRGRNTPGLTYSAIGLRLVRLP